MSLFLNGIETNKVIWNGVETTGYFNGNMVWGYTAPTSSLLLNSANYTSSWNGNNSNNYYVNLNCDLSNYNYDYYALKFKSAVKKTTSNSLYDYNIHIVSNNKDWYQRGVSPSPNPTGAMGVYYYYGTSNTAQAFPGTMTGVSTTRGTRDVKYWIALNYNNNQTQKFIYNNKENKIHLFVNNVEKMTMTGVDVCTAINYIKYGSVATYYCSAHIENIQIAGFNNLSDAAAWNP